MDTECRNTVFLVRPSHFLALLIYLMFFSRTVNAHGHTHAHKHTHSQTWLSSTPVSGSPCAVDNTQLQALGKRNLQALFSRLALYIYQISLTENKIAYRFSLIVFRVWVLFHKQPDYYIYSSLFEVLGSFNWLSNAIHCKMLWGQNCRSSLHPDSYRHPIFDP